MFPGFVICLTINMLLLHFRSKKWCPDRFRWSLTVSFSIFGICGLIFHPKLFGYNDIGYTQFFSPIIYNSLDRFYRILSIRKQKRDFYLASNIDFWVNNWSNNYWPKLTTMDELMSGSLYFLIGVMPPILYGVQKLILMH